MTTKTSNRKLISIESAKDTDGTDLSIYKYEVEKNGKTGIQTVKTRKTRKYKDQRYDPTKDKDQVITELIKYFNNYKFTQDNQLDEFRLLARNNAKLKEIVEHLFATIKIKLTQLELRQIINVDLSERIKVSIKF